MTFFVMDTFVTVQFHAAEGKGERLFPIFRGRCGLEGILSSPQTMCTRIDQAASRSR